MTSITKNKKKEGKKDSFGSVESVLNRAEEFVETKQKLLLYVFGGILGIVLLILGYIYVIKQPRQIDSYTYSYKAEEYFAIDSFNLALNGDGVNMGFLEIIDEYSSTKMGNLSKYYAGVCYMQLGQFEEAIDMLESFRAKDDVIYPHSLALLGDANVEIDNLKLALKYYLKAADKAQNEVSSPSYLMKAANVCKLLGEYKQAFDIYTRIDKEYHSYEQNNNLQIEKYIQEVKEKM